MDSVNGSPADPDRGLRRNRFVQAEPRMSELEAIRASADMILVVGLFFCLLFIVYKSDTGYDEDDWL